MKFKQIGLMAAIAALSAMTMAQEPSEAKRSRNLSMNNPVSGYLLSTDGKFNSWYSKAAILSGTSVTVTKQTGAVTASGVNNLVTPTATITKQTGAVTATAVVTPQAPTTVTPTITLTPETGAITATATPTLQSPGAQTPTITVTIQATTIYDATGAACTNAAGEVVGVVTGATATCSALPNFPTNLTIAVSVVGGGAVWTNATAACSALPDFATNATAAITVIGGDAVMTNATCAITPDLASNGVVAVSVTGGDAVVTNVSMTVP